MSDEKDNEKNSDDVNTQPVKKQSAEPVNSDETITQPVVKSKDDLNSGEGVLDPLTLRDSDTSKLKRVKPKSATQTVNLDSENVSDTVHLKVIKEKKKQLAGILTASQTIRLRPPASPQQPPAAGGGPQSSQTLKISPSAPSGSGTVSMPPAGGGSAGTLKINMPASSSESGTIKVSKPNFAESSSAGTLKIKNPSAVTDSASGSGTLKIKSAAASPASASGTLKLKAAAAPAEETVKIGSDVGKGGTVKLKAKSTVNQTAPSPSKRVDTQEDVAVAVQDDPKAKPGIWMTLSSLVAIAAVGTIVFMCIDNYMELFSVLNK